MKTQLIGIAGSTCSGKSTLLKNLQTELGDAISTLTFDEYFIGSDLYDLDDITNFEDPELYNYAGFIEDLKKLKSGKSLGIRANSRESSHAGIKHKTIPSHPIIVVEGFLIFHDSQARDLFDKRLFIDLPDDEIVKRRHSRSSGSKHWDSLSYIQNKIIPYHHEYVTPQRRHAELVLDGLQTPDQLTQQVLKLLV